MGWVLPIMWYVVALGAVGVTTKLALRTLSWQDLILWVGVGYVLVAGILLALGQAKWRFVGDTSWALVTTGLVISSLIALYIALGNAEASKVIPVSAAYPAVTLFLSALVLSERVSVARVAGAGLVVVGVVVLTAAR